ncbi:hypothetical protein ACHRV6_22985 [Flavobacterium sp. FlaQc-51]|uniref:hypothetical protein n=1 Tax=Flavobacterium sp. FlaQc-51 TaxID=3374184 RepID=UPI0037581AA4
MERPKICCLDIKEEDLNVLKKKGFNVFEGSIGAKVKVPNQQGKSHSLLINNDFPENLHEFDIIIVDLDNFNTTTFNGQEHEKNSHTGKQSSSIRSSYPENLFDPRPLSSYILGNSLNDITNREYLVIAFSTSSYVAEYQEMIVSDKGTIVKPNKSYNIYSFWNDIPLKSTKKGIEVIITDGSGDLGSLLNKYKEGISYNQTFHHPTQGKVVDGRYIDVEDERYFPLIKNSNEDIVSYIETNDNKNLILFPQLENKGEFLSDLLSNILPSIFPKLFPYSTKFLWKEKEEYWLPNHLGLIGKKQQIQKEYDEKLLKNDLEITENKIKYSFLHNLLTETGDELVKSIITFFEWLEFSNVKDFDETKTESSILEEDIQIQLDKGLLIIECKGIAGTSTDSDCSQISKIKHRRCKERKAFDVFALYIVNHQRHLDPINRQNPPFQKNQIQDAIDEERGLLTTWQLFNLYFEIESNIISKEEAKNAILGFGLINFTPNNIIYIDTPKEFFSDNKVCIVNIKDLCLDKNQEYFFEKNGKFERVKLLGIMLDDKQVLKAENGEYGLKFDLKIPKKSKLWLRMTSQIDIL